MFTEDILAIGQSQRDNTMDAALNLLSKYPHIAPDPALYRALYDCYLSCMPYVADPSACISFEDALFAAESLLEQGLSKQAVCQLMPTYCMYGYECLIEDYLETRIICDPGISLDAWAKRQETNNSRFRFEAKNHQEQFSDLLNLARSRSQNFRENKKRKTQDWKHMRQYRSNIEAIYNYFKQQHYFPACALDACYSAMEQISYFNTIYKSVSILFGLIDGTTCEMFADGEKKMYIQKETWLQAIELMLSLEDMDFRDIYSAPNPATDKEMAERMDQKYPTVICLGVLIHTLRIFDDRDIRQLLYNKQIGKDKTEAAPDVAGMERQIRELTRKLDNANKEIERLKQSNQSLQVQANSVTKNDVTELVHEHNMRIKEKDQKICSLEEIVKQLERGLAHITKRSHRALSDSYAPRPWLEQKLPETGVLFVGGNQNLLKKLQQRYPNWTYVGTENAPLPTNIQVIFVMTNHSLSHGVWYRLNRFYQNRELMRYVQATNLDKLEQEMQYEYWEMLRCRKD